MKVLRLVPLVLALAACSFEKVPLSPYRIDVQQGNALEQESVEKLRLGLNRSQVRFLLGTPLLVDPFHNNRWDYVYNFRKAGKLTEERRLALFFDGDVLVRIEAEGFPPKGELPSGKPLSTPQAASKPAEPTRPAEPARPADAKPSAAVAPVPATEPPAPAAVAAIETSKAAPVAMPESRPAARAADQPQPVAVPATPARVSTTGKNSLDQTSVVAPMQSDLARPAAESAKPAAATEIPPENVALQAAVNVEAIRPDVMPEFPKGAAPASPEEQVAQAVNAWAEAWRSRNEEAYLAAYAASFRPEGGQSREEWEKRRRLLLGISRNVDVQVDGLAIEVVTEDRAQVSFRQFYRSDSYQDAVIKQLKLVRVDNLWLIEEEKALAPIKVKK